jgi:hypothetical protein
MRQFIGKKFVLAFVYRLILKKIVNVLMGGIFTKKFNFKNVFTGSLRKHAP